MTSGPLSHRLGALLSLALLSATLLSGCGAASGQLAPARPSAAAAALGHRDDPDLSRPVRATSALAYAHAMARQLDPKALFILMTGNRIGAQGAPVQDGTWQIEYVGANVPAPANAPAPGNPYAIYTRHITITIDASGHTHTDVTEQAGLPLGLGFLDRPMPTIDSSAAVKLARKQLPSLGTVPLQRLTLSGAMGANHLPRLVWRVGLTSQGGEPALLLDATTGEVIEREKPAGGL